VSYWRNSFVLSMNNWLQLISLVPTLITKITQFTPPKLSLRQILSAVNALSLTSTIKIMKIHKNNSFPICLRNEWILLLLLPLLDWGIIAIINMHSTRLLCALAPFNSRLCLFVGKRGANGAQNELEGCDETMHGLIFIPNELCEK
jgi:hypothetical protein